MVYFLIPIYNEEANIPNLYKELSNVLPGEEKFFVFSDDGSTDKSVNTLSIFFKDVPHIILGDGKNYGPGNAFNTGFEWVLKNGNHKSDIVVTLEADCTSDTSILLQMVSINRLGYSLVLASVYAQGGEFDKTSFMRKLLSSIANLFFRFIFDVKVLTLSSFYRVYSLALLKEIKENNTTIISEKGFICMLEILLKAIKQNASIIEVPMVLYSSKRIGKSKMKIFKTSIAYVKFLFKYKKDDRK